MDRTLLLVGKPVSAQDRTGLVWHTQGSGKSLTMIFAGQKLRRHPALNNPTVLIVVDRRDIKTQLSDDFDACDYPNVEKALGVEDLKQKLSSDWRGTLVTTIQSFQGMGDLVPLTRDNIVSLVDECHRSQTSSGRSGTKSYALTMRVTREWVPVWLYWHSDRSYPAEHAPRLRPAEGRRPGALSQLLRYSSLHSGWGDAGGALRSRHCADQH